MGNDDLRLRYDPETRVLRGRAGITATATQDLSSFNLDLRGFEHQRRARQWPACEAHARWSGADGPCAPEAARRTDKATYRFVVTVAEGYTAVANGILRREHTRRRGTTFVWEAGDPMASYLTTASVGRFELTRGHLPDGLPTFNAVDVDLVGDPGLSVFDNTPAYLDHLAGVYGSYRFEAIGAIVDDAEEVGGDPGADDLFGTSVYLRGAMTLHVLRTELGDEAFFEILREWVAEYGGGTATTSDFVALAERVSGQPLDALFTRWLYDEGKPELP